VFKHSLLTQLVLTLEKKDKPFFVLDTHAGTGLYDLTHAWAQKNAEYKDGIALLWERKDVPNTWCHISRPGSRGERVRHAAFLSRLAAHRGAGCFGRTIAWC